MAKTIILNGYYFRVINPKTQRADAIKTAFGWSSDVTLDDAYGRYSKAKEFAYQYCRKLERAFNSFDGRITGHNTCTFSYAFTGYADNGKKYLIYITHGDYAIEIGE